MRAQSRDQHRPLLIHPGFHKTGTTFLQREIFTDQRLFRLLWGHEEVHRYVIGPHELDFDPRSGREAIDALRSPGAPDLIDVISSETLCGTPFFGSRESAARARRLKAIFGEAQILITVRRQKIILRSIYLQYLRQGGTLNAAAFFDQERPYDYFGFDAKVFEYHKLVELYAELFGEENILVLTQETLRPDPDGFVRTLCAFCVQEAEVATTSPGPSRSQNVSPEASGIPLLRLASRLQGGPVNPEMRTPLASLGWLLRRVAQRQTWFFRDQSARLDEAIAQRFTGRFADSNARLQKYAADDLAELGYEISARSPGERAYRGAAPRPANRLD